MRLMFVAEFLRKDSPNAEELRNVRIPQSRGPKKAAKKKGGSHWQLLSSGETQLSLVPAGGL